MFGSNNIDYFTGVTNTTIDVTERCQIRVCLTAAAGSEDDEGRGTGEEARQYFSFNIS